MTAFWIKKAWGANSVDEAVFADVETAISETLSVKDKHSAFWAGDGNGKVLEVQQREDLIIMYLCDENSEEVIKAILDDWDQVRHFFSLFFESKMDELTQLFIKRI